MEGLAQRVREQRLKQGISKRALARKVQVSPETIHKIESGKTKSPRAYLLAKIADALGVDLSFLIYGSRTSIAISQVGDRLEIKLPYTVTLDPVTVERLSRWLSKEFDILGIKH